MLSTGRRITQAAVDNTSVKLIPKGTVLVSFKLTIGKVAIAGKELYTNEAIVGLKPKDDRVLPEFLYHVIPAIDLKSYTQKAAKGLTLNKKIIESIRIPVPPISEQRAFIEKMNDLEAEAQRLREQASDVEKDRFDVGKSFLAN